MDSLDMASEEEEEEVTAGVEELNSDLGRVEDEATDEAET